MASAAFITASTGFGISMILGISMGFAASLAGAVLDGSIAAGSGNARLICFDEEEASAAGAAGIGGGVLVSVLSLMGVPSFVVDELETTAVTKTFKI